MPELPCARARVPARAALAGNPSDGHGGAVLAVTVEALTAEAVAVRSEPGAGPWDGGSSPVLSVATVRRFYRDVLGAPVQARVSFTTSVPRCVGLGGSSAIVVAILRALAELHQIEIPPDRMADMALSVEVEDLGIAAGLQDRVAQCYGGLTFMEFASPRRYESLDPRLLPPLLVAWLADAAQRSGGVHEDLGRRGAAGEELLSKGMRQLAATARAAREALLRGDNAAFAACVDASFDARARIMKLDPRHVGMVEVARREGAAANYTGSGGAVVCACESVRHREAVTHALERHGCSTVPV